MEESKHMILEAKKEYTKFLTDKLHPVIYQGLQSIWKRCLESAKPNDEFIEFQKSMAKVPKWNQDIIELEYKRITDKLSFDWFEELLKTIFILNTQVLASISLENQNKKIKIKVPPGSTFIHHCYKECARSFWENPLLMEDRPKKISKKNQLKNLQISKHLITVCIENTIRNLLPMENILKNTMEIETDTSETIHNPFYYTSSFVDRKEKEIEKEKEPEVIPHVEEPKYTSDTFDNLKNFGLSDPTVIEVPEDIKVEEEQHPEDIKVEQQHPEENKEEENNKVTFTTKTELFNTDDLFLPKEEHETEKTIYFHNNNNTRESDLNDGIPALLKDKELSEIIPEKQDIEKLDLDLDVLSTVEGIRMVKNEDSEKFFSDVE